MAYVGIMVDVESKRVVIVEPAMVLEDAKEYIARLELYHPYYIMSFNDGDTLEETETSFYEWLGEIGITDVNAQKHLLYKTLVEIRRLAKIKMQGFDYDDCDDDSDDYEDDDKWQEWINSPLIVCWR